MTLKQIYDLAVEMGIKADPRGKENVQKLLEKANKAYQDMPEKKKKFFDKERLANPYSDTRILYGDPEKKIKKLMAGIDADASEVLLADRLREKGEGVDLLISHHPSGHALAALHEVMDIQVDLMHSFGVPVNIAESLLSERVDQVKRRLSPANHNQSVDTARLLDVPLMAIHTVWDNMGWNFMTDYLSGKKYDSVGEILEDIEDLPEFAEAKRGKNGPVLTSGAPKNRPGKVVVSGFTGGTEGSKKIYEKLSQAGVGTIIEMHMSEEHYSEAKKHHLNVIVTGHMASDSIGANIFLDELEKRGVETVPCSGLIRVKRSGKST